MQMPELLTSEELADRLKVAASTLQSWARDGIIPSIKINPKVIRFDEAEVIVTLLQLAKQRKEVTP